MTGARESVPVAELRPVLAALTCSCWYPDEVEFAVEPCPRCRLDVLVNGDEAEVGR